MKHTSPVQWLSASKLRTLIVAISVLMSFSQARYSKINFQAAMDDYNEAFKTKELDFEFEKDTSVKDIVSLQSEPEQTKLLAESHPVVGQEDSYDGYIKPKEAFSKTDSYQYALQFKIGAKLDNNYEYVDECFDAWVLLFDDIAYYQNNVTYTQVEINNGTLDNWWFTYLNLTGLIFGPISDIVVDCYRFAESVADYEIDRFVSFNNDWGEFFLSFLFNQMGNALQFQAKFTRIQEYQTKQNYQSIWLEYGDLVYLIWTFDPLSSGSYDSILDMLSDFVETHELMDPEQPYHQFVQSTGLPVIASHIEQMSRDVNDFMNEASTQVVQFFDDLKSHNRTKLFVEDTQFVNTFADPWTIPSFNVNEDVVKLLYGIANGAIDVFPYTSNPNRCRNNITQAWGAGVNWYNWPYDFVNSADDRLTVFKEISYFLELPFGVSYSCYWGFSTILIDSDPMEDGVISEDERLEEMITLGSDIPTNLFFNVGYMYGDIFSLYDMADTTKDYWEKFGRYCGDFLIRIFWRSEFLRNFDYGEDDEDE